MPLVIVHVVAEHAAFYFALLVIGCVAFFSSAVSGLIER